MSPGLNTRETKGLTMAKYSFPLLLTAALICSALPAASQELPEGNGKDLVAADCNSCHTFFSRVGNGYDTKGWHTVLRMMINQGVPVPNDQLPTMTAYLVKNFPERNKATAKVMPGSVAVSFQEWPVPTAGSRPHDPLAARDGSFWYTGHTGSLIGKLDPKTGAVTEYKLPGSETLDPHTPIFDKSGVLWFSVQNANKLERLDPKTGAIKLIELPTAKSRPYGMALNSKGVIFFDEFGTNKIGRIDPATQEIREYPLPDPGARPRRIAITSDDIVWYTDYARGFLGRVDPATGKVTEWQSPSGPKSAPYGISVIKDVLWYSESEATPNTIVRFDPKTEKFQSWVIPGGGNIVRNTSVTRDGKFVLANSLVNTVTLVTIRK